jgi:DNA mismatch repair protein MutS2
LPTFSADLLEFEALRELISRYIHSALGAAELEQIEPHNDRAALESVLADTAETIEYLRNAMQPQTASRGAAIRLSFDALPDVEKAVALLRIEGAGLEAKQIFELTSMLEQAAEMRGILTSAVDKYPRLAGKGANLADLRPVLRELRGKILPDGSLANDASVALNRLRRDIEKQQRQVHTSLERFLKTHHEDGTLQEDFITIRNDRFVVPIVTGQQRKVSGVIHGASGSGHTLFVEPLETIDLNNELVRLREEEMREVHRILRELTNLLRVHSPAVGKTMAALGDLELLFAKAQFAVEFDCVVPTFTPDKSRALVLRDARHPLLQDVLKRRGKVVLPISLALDETCRTLLISGPNTGGKTVSMKTVGLMVLMAQAGLPVPAAEAKFPIFDQVLADIGDNQSIQESLSTFSAHIAHIREMLADATRDSLVLLDELGRATDPEEGGALGVAILDTFRSTGAFTLASTHLMAIKVYGETTQGVVNASMGFDEATLEPTYVLRLGAPGKSAGLDIAKRLGMPDYLIDRARSTMSTQERDIARFLTELHDRLDRAVKTEEEQQRRVAALTVREQGLAKEWEQRERNKIREVEQRCEIAIAQFEAQARETIDQILQTSDHKKAADQAMRRVSKTRREFKEQVQTAVFQNTVAAKPVIPIQEGSQVRLKGIRELARVRRLLGEDRIEVEAGFMKLQVPIDDVEEVLPAGKETARLPRNVSYEPGPTWDVSYREINIIGHRAEEAREEVDKFLDSAAMASVDRVRIVHGHGMGILKKAIGELLTVNPHVEKFYPATPAEGGTGATIVELK